MNQIKLIIFSLCMLLAIGAEAQLPRGRTNSTIIADALAQLPADTPQQYNIIIADLVSTGEEGLLDLIGRINPPGKETNEAYEFAINGWSHFVSKDEAKRIVAANAFEKALSKSLDKEVKAFIIRQLRTIGSDDNVVVLSGYLTDDYLSGPASAALTSIGTEKAGVALLSALTASNSEKIKLNLVNALGQINFSQAEQVLLNLLSNNPSNKLESVLLSALAKIGGKESIKPLKDAAVKVDLAYHKSNAVGSYINLLGKLGSSEAKTVKKEAEKLLSKAKKQNISELKIASTKILLEQSNANASKILKGVIKDGDIKYITNILYAYPFDNDKKSVELIQKEVLSNKSNDVKTSLIYWLGNTSKGSTESITPYINSSNKMILKAATQSLSKIGGENAIIALAGLLKSSDLETVTLAKNALMSIDGDISYTLASVFEDSGDEGKKAILEIISSRILESQYNLVYNQMFSDNKVVKAAAANTLKYIVTDKNINDQFTLLEQTEAEHVPAIQESINAALKNLSKDEQTKLVSERISKSAKKHLYYSALAGIGSTDAIEQITEAYNKETGANRDAAFNALASVNSFNAIYQVLDIARSTSNKSELEKVANALINIVRRSNQTGEIKYLYLREAMQFAQNDTQKKTILSLIGGISHYPAILYVAKYLDNTSISEAAALAAMNIALSNAEFAGEETTAILKKVSETLTNPDADYQRQSINKYLSENQTEGGYVSLFNGKNLDGWKGLVGNPLTRAKMSARELATAQVKADKQMALDWKVEDGMIVFDGKGYDNLCTEKQYGDFEILIDWKLYPGPEPDAGLYLRGTPQVQIWDTARVDVGAQVGSGGLYNNQQHPSNPLKVADQRVGDWNTFKIRMIGERVSVWLNGELVTDNVVLENFWDRTQPIFSVEQIELQAHGSKVAYRDIYIKEIPRPEPFKLSAEEKAEGFRILFDGTNLDEWTGNKKDYTVESGNIVLYPHATGSGGNLYTNDDFDNFIFRFEFLLTPGANNGLGIRSPLRGDAAYSGMELQILDNDAPIYANLEKYQYHGSVYGVIPAKRGALKPLGEWNYQEVIADGDNIKITLNGTTILDGNIKEASKNGTIDGKEHPGLLNKTGRIGFLGHGSKVKFRNIRVKEL